MDKEKKIKSRELMRSMFVDLNSSTDRKDYLNNKSNEIIRKKEELGYKSGRLDLRSFENFYNEISKKTQVEVEQLYELFLNFINSTSVELVEEKIVFFEKMLYIFFSKTDEQLNFWKFYQKKFEEETATGVMFLNDSEFMLERALELPVFEASNGHKFYFRQTLIIKGGKIRRAYIVDEPENDAKNMLEKIKNEDY